MPAEVVTVPLVEYPEVRAVEVHSDLLEDDLALDGEVGVAQGGPHHVAEEVGGLRQPLGEDHRIVDGPLLTGVGVVAGAELVEFPIDVVGAPAVGPLKEHVLEEVGDAGDLSSLVPGSGPDEVADRYALGAGEVLPDQGQPVFQSCGVEGRVVHDST